MTEQELQLQEVYHLTGNERKIAYLEYLSKYGSLDVQKSANEELRFQNKVNNAKNI